MSSNQGQKLNLNYHHHSQTHPQVRDFSIVSESSNYTVIDELVNENNFM